MDAARVSELETTVRNVLAKNERLEKELDQERQKTQDLSCKVRGKDEQLRQAQVSRATDEGSAGRERQLQEEIKKLKGDNLRLLNQLQAEKASNVRPLYGMQRESCANAYDRDDDEDLRSVTESVRATPAPSNSSGIFSRPFIMPEGPVFKTLRAFESALSFDQNLCIRTKPDAVLTKKRKRTRQEEIDEELPDLHIEDFEPTTGLRKKQCSTSVAGNDTFTFSAISDYDAARKPLAMSSERIKKCKPLWDRIQLVTEIWEHNKGEDWLFEFESNGNKTVIPPCLTSKMASRKTRWRQDGAGKYACRDCVKNGRPCFTWTEVQMNKNDAKKWSLWEFRLLPMHLNDRTRSVGKGDAAVRYWVNDDVKFQDKDVRTKDDGDEEYVD